MDKNGYGKIEWIQIAINIEFHITSGEYVRFVLFKCLHHGWYFIVVSPYNQEYDLIKYIFIYEFHEWITLPFGFSWVLVSIQYNLSRRQRTTSLDYDIIIINIHRAEKSEGKSYYAISCVCLGILALTYHKMTSNKIYYSNNKYKFSPRSLFVIFSSLEIILMSVCSTSALCAIFSF